MFSIVAITPDDTHDLRRRVLRSNDPNVDAVVWDGDDDAGTVHFGAIDPTGTIVAISTWLEAGDPLAPDLRSTQLRGMATDPGVAGGGIGRMLLAAGVEHARRQKSQRVWANARVTALGFYERAGFSVSGPIFTTPVTGLPHRHVHLDLT